MDTFWSRVLRLMDQQNISQVQIGNHVGKSKGTVNSWISRDVIPAGDITLAISKLLNSSVEYLVTGIDPQDRSQMADVRRKFLQFIDQSSDEDLQKMWDFIAVLRGR